MKFKIGDVCRVVGCREHPFRSWGPGYPGIEVTIVGYKKTVGHYSVEFEGSQGVPHHARECCLELKRPPGVELGKWEECPWRPSIEVMHEG